MKKDYPCFLKIRFPFLKMFLTKVLKIDVKADVILKCRMRLKLDLQLTQEFLGDLKLLSRLLLSQNFGLKRTVHGKAHGP